MIILKLKKLYISALSIVAAVLVLLVFISTSTYRNLNREEEYVRTFLLQQGSSLIQVLTASTQLHGDAMDTLFKEAAQSPDIDYLYLTDARCIITHHSDPTLVGTPAAPENATALSAGVIRKTSKGLRIFEMARPFSEQTTIVLGLKMTAFDEARKADLHHAVIMLAIVLALGAGTLFFFSVIYNYYSVEKTLEKTREKVRRAERLAAIGKLAAGVAHEIRNPLSSIRGFAKFLSHTLADRPEEKEYADIMVREVDRINQVVSDLLTYSRPMTLEQTRVDLPGLVDHTLRLVSADADSRHIRLLRHLPDRMEPLWVDPGQITQALLNLLLNSLQAVNDHGCIEVGAGLDPADELLHIWVEDDGRGVAPEILENITDPFFTTRDQGTGLGLAIVHKIAENHRGELRIFSPVPGKTGGTRISLLIPGVLREEKEEEAQDDTQNSRGR